ncbi:MAG: alpha/beta hydrolase [Gammaproteobacteria bacterium]|nr:alpha/beta hydrolase [Gammaproteobacteria bacterium]
MISAEESSVVDVVFVHGLKGQARKTWSNEGDDGFWPAWLVSDLEKVSVYTLDYPISVFEKRAKKEMDLYERAANVLEILSGFGIGKRPIVFVAHSLGGLLVKQILRKATESDDEDWCQVAASTQMVFFIATPHHGSELAKLGKVFPYTSKHIALLTNETGFLDDLNEHYKAFVNKRQDLTTVSYYEKHTTKSVVVVTRDSADPGVARSYLNAVDKDHINISKPANRFDTIYMGVKRRIEKLIQSIDDPESFALAEYYEEKSPADRRDLHQKLLDAGREHEYGYANNAQNGFARRYTKTGLLSTARENHDNLLSEVETRFITHVYHPLICQSAEHHEIAQALQDRVIDPLVGRSIGGTKFDAKSVLSAVYFLTEQCYIRWDAPK